MLCSPSEAFHPAPTTILAKPQCERGTFARIAPTKPPSPHFLKPSTQLRALPLPPLDSALTLASASPIPSALFAYAHYLGLLLVVSSLVSERLLIKPGMSESDFDKVAFADITYGLAGTLVLFSGYFRATEYGKGWEFYAHSPVFWVKMFLFAVMGSASFFPTTKVIQRAIAKKNLEDAGESPPPMWSDALIERLTSVVNAELLAVLSIPLAATLMARGVGYNDGLPWFVGAAPSFLAIGGLGYKYIKEAISWEEENEEGAVVN